MEPTTQSAVLPELLLLVAGPFSAISVIVCLTVAILSLQVWIPIIAGLRNWWMGLFLFLIPLSGAAYAATNWDVGKRPLIVAFAALGGVFLTLAIRWGIVLFLLQ